MRDDDPGVRVTSKQRQAHGSKSERDDVCGAWDQQRELEGDWRRELEAQW